MSTAFFDCSKNIIERFDSQWSGSDKVYEADQYTPVVGSAFTVLRVIPLTFSRITLGSNSGQNNNRVIGSIYAEIFTPIDVGMGIALQLVDGFNTIFKDQTFNGVMCKDCLRVGSRPSSDVNFLLTPISCRFWFDEVG